MIDICERNNDMLVYSIGNEETVEEIKRNIICPNGLLHDFKELIYEVCTEHYRLYTEAYNETIKRNVLVYLIEDEDDLAFMSQVYNIPGRKITDVEFVIFISERFLLDNEIIFKCILGHELAHVDFYNLPKYNSHGAQDRYPFIEIYCDLKGYELVNNSQAIRENVKTIKRQIGINNKREIELRFTFLRLFLKRIVDSRMLYKYIERNYLRHMEKLESIVEFHDERMYDYKIVERKYWSDVKEKKFIDYCSSLLQKYIA